jgi:hypothetical protein
MAAVRPFVLKLDINGAQGGRTEKYFLDPGTNTAPTPTMVQLGKNICFGRSAFFGAEAKIVYARISYAGGPPDRYIIPLDYPLGPHAAAVSGGAPGGGAGPINDDNVAIFTVAQVTGAMGANHYINFVPDGWVAGQKLIAGLAPYFQPAATPPTGPLGPTWGGTHLSLCQAFWALLRDQTSVAKKQTNTSYILQKISDWVYRNVTSHKVGPFRGLHRGRRQKALIR